MLYFRGYLFLLTGFCLYIAAIVASYPHGFVGAVLLLFVLGQGLNGIFDLRITALLGFLMLPLPLTWLISPNMTLLVNLALCPVPFLLYWKPTQPLIKRILTVFTGTITTDDVQAFHKQIAPDVFYRFAGSTQSSLTLITRAPCNAPIPLYQEPIPTSLETLSTTKRPQAKQTNQDIDVHLRKKFRQHFGLALGGYEAVRTHLHESAHDTLQRVSLSSQ